MHSHNIMASKRRRCLPRTRAKYRVERKPPKVEIPALVIPDDFSYSGDSDTWSDFDLTYENPAHLSLSELTGQSEAEINYEIRLEKARYARGDPVYYDEDGYRHLCTPLLPITLEEDSVPKELAVRCPGRLRRSSKRMKLPALVLAQRVYRCIDTKPDGKPPSWFRQLYGAPSWIFRKKASELNSLHKALTLLVRLNWHLTLSKNSGLAYLARRRYTPFNGVGSINGWSIPRVLRSTCRRFAPLITGI